MSENERHRAEDDEVIGNRPDDELSDEDLERVAGGSKPSEEHPLAVNYSTKLTSQDKKKPLGRKTGDHGTARGAKRKPPRSRPTVAYLLPLHLPIHRGQMTILELHQRPR